MTKYFDLVVEWLEEQLSEGPLPSNIIYQRAKSEDFSRKTLERAKDKLEIQSQRAPSGEWWWYNSVITVDRNMKKGWFEKNADHIKDILEDGDAKDYLLDDKEIEDDDIKKYPKEDFWFIEKDKYYNQSSGRSEEIGPGRPVKHYENIYVELQEQGQYDIKVVREKKKDKEPALEVAEILDEDGYKVHRVQRRPNRRRFVKEYLAGLPELQRHWEEVLEKEGLGLLDIDYLNLRKGV